MKMQKTEPGSENRREGEELWGAFSSSPDVKPQTHIQNTKQCGNEYSSSNENVLPSQKTVPSLLPLAQPLQSRLTEIY